ncbi:MAG TPA: hypothetical protein VMK84_34745 [Streptosporangiaceae bacterium]|nr:hypothetical protein [Streptosporangiaceae bacterium]
MSFTGVKDLDQSIDKTNAWLAEIAAEFGTEDRYVSGGALDEALDVLPPDLSQLVEPAGAGRGMTA